MWKQPKYPSLVTKQTKCSISIQGLFFKKKWNIDTCYNMNEFWEDYAKWKKPDTKKHILYDSMYTKYPEDTNPWGQQGDWQRLPRAGEAGRDGTWLLKGTCLWGGENVLKWTVAMTTELCPHAQNHWILNFRWMCTPCEHFSNNVS